MASYYWTSASTAKPGAPPKSTTSNTVPVGTSYGIDLTTWAAPGQTSPDLDPNFTLIDERSQRGVIEAAARKLCMARGALRDSPNEGYDLRAQLRKKWTRQVLFNVQTACEGETEKDERVYSSSAAIKWNETNRELTVRILIDSMFGNFQLNMSIDDVTVAKLRQG